MLKLSFPFIVLFLTSSSVNAQMDVQSDPLFIIFVCLFIGFVLLFFLVTLIRRCCCPRRLVIYESVIVPEQSRTLIPPPQETTPILSPVIVNVNSPTAPAMPRPQEHATHGSNHYGYAPAYGVPPPPYNATQSALPTHYNNLVPEYPYSSQYGPPPPKYQF